ncbi:lipid II:glycine glycyltransferase FemX [Ornithinimicrobium panacihumi]|uniref:lipid II:glycine glycyltransferase FemX n=1 Tax=Ornithinimicrobium panacihumi TaxID=2008449 RepID=UPI003F8B58AA
MTMREATAEEKARWEDLVWDSPAGPDLMQLVPYAQVKAATWGFRQMVHSFPGREDLPVLYLVRKVPPFGEFWYAPMGPRVTDQEHLALVCDDLRAGGAFAVIMEPAIAAEGPTSKADLAATIPGLEEFIQLQPGTSTVFIDLEPSEEELMASFRQRARRYIRKTGEAVIEHRTDDASFEQLWKLYVPTISDRAGLPLRPKDYYLDAWRLYRDRGEGHVILAYSSPERHEQGEPEAGIYLWQHRDLGYYRDGGSIRTPEANGLQYRVQWEAMRWCKEQGATTYDMFGAPPSWAVDDKSHQMHGLVQFKTAFGQITDTVGTMRLVVDPKRAKAWDKVGVRVYWRMGRKKNPLFY